MRKSYLLFLAMLALGSCKDEMEQPVSTEQSSNVEDECFNIKALYSTNHTISRKQAEEIALEFVNEDLNDGNGVNSLKRTKTIRKVAGTVVRSGGNGLKSNGQNQDTLGYYVNFADNNGYAYVCADDRVDAGVLALFDNGNFEGETDSLSRPIYNRIDNYVSSSIDKFEDKKEQRLIMVEEAIKNGELDTCTSNNQTKGVLYTKVNYVYGPFLQATLNQHYNDLLPYCTCPTCISNNEKNKGNSKYVKKRVLPGCLAIALAQYTAYWRDLQNEYDGNRFIDCSKVNGYYSDDKPKQQITRYFFNQLNEAGGITHKSCAYTSATSSCIPNVRGFLKHEIKQEPHDFNSLSIINWLKKYKSPVFIEGEAVNGGYDHVWLCDGVLARYKAKNYIFIRIPIEKEMCYFHYNWGWGGSFNGFFLDDIFVKTNGASLYDESDGNPKYKNYQYNNLKIWGLAPDDYETISPKYPNTTYWDDLINALTQYDN